MLKDSVLAILIKENGYISGEKISSSLGVSRTAVNSAVKALREDGCEILSATNKGYCLESAPDRLAQGDVMALLSRQRMESVICLDTVESTNDVLRKMAFEGAPDGQVVIANAQTKGRGRRGRSFSSQRDTGIYMSFLLRPECCPDKAVTITAWTAVAAARAIETVCGVHTGIKWVNDLVLGKKKLCGILTEMSVESESGHIQHIIVGIGINVNNKPEDFSQELRETATSIYAQTGKWVVRSHLAAQIIKEMDEVRRSCPDKGETYLDEYRERCVTTGAEVSVISPEGAREGTALQVNDDFSLKVEYRDGTTADISSGEVSVRGLYGYIE